MADPILDHRQAARAILGTSDRLSEREGQFLGALAFRDDPLSGRQAHWLGVLLSRHGLPEWNLQSDGGEHD